MIYKQIDKTPLSCGLWQCYNPRVYPLILAGSTGAVLFFLFQAALIIGLLVNRAKRRQGEAEATLIAEISSKFVNLPASEVDREIMDAERRICEALDLDISVIWQLVGWASGLFHAHPLLQQTAERGNGSPRTARQLGARWPGHLARPTGLRAGPRTQSAARSHHAQRRSR